MRFEIGIVTTAMLFAGSACVAPEATVTTSQAATATTGAPLPGISAAAFQTAQNAFTNNETITDGTWPAVQRHQLRQLPQPRWRRRRRRPDRQALRAIRRRQVRSAGRRRRRRAVAVLARHVQPRVDAVQGAGRDRAGRRHDPRRPVVAAAVRPRPGRRDAGRILRHAGRRRARRGARHGEAPGHPAAQPGRSVAIDRRDPRRAVRLEGRADQPRRVLGRRVYHGEMWITTQSCVERPVVPDLLRRGGAPNGVPVAPGCDDLAPPPPAGVRRPGSTTRSAAAPTARPRSRTTSSSS